MARKGHPEGRKHAVGTSVREYARGLIGGLLFSLPLLYTMEVWWAGFIARPSGLLIYFLTGFLLLFGYNRFAGLREDAGWLEVAFEAVEEMGLGLLVAAGMLWLLGQIDAGLPWSEVMGKVVVEAVTVAIGISVGSSQLGGGQNHEAGGMAGEDPEQAASLWSQLVLGACGAVLFATNIAPTEEVLMIAVETSPWRLAGLALLSLVLGGLILFYSDFHASERLQPDRGPGTVVTRTVINYAVALAASAFILWFFGRFDGASFAACLAQTVVLGVASSLGASAGRLLLQ